MTPDVIRPILLPSYSVNQRLPSGPAVIPLSWLASVRTSNSVSVPLGVIYPILLPAVNQRLPSGPAVIPLSRLASVGTANSVSVPLGVIRPILLPSYSVNQRLPSGPPVIPDGPL